MSILIQWKNHGILKFKDLGFGVGFVWAALEFLHLVWWSIS